jgi:hypothetical protein
LICAEAPLSSRAVSKYHASSRPDSNPGIAAPSVLSLGTRCAGKKIDFATLFNGRSPPNQWLIIYTDQGALLSLLNFMQHKDNLQEWLRTIASAPDEAERAALILKIKREYELWLP